MKAKFIIKISAKNIKSHPWREAIIIVFLSVALALFCISIAASEFSYASAQAECLFKYEEMYAVNSSTETLNEENSGDLISAGGKHAYMESGYMLPGMNALPSISLFLSPEPTDKYSDGNFSLCDPDNFIYADEDFISAIGWSITGRTPSAKNEIMISECLYKQFEELGYYDNITYPLGYDEQFNITYDEAGVSHFTSEEEFLALSPKVYEDALEGGNTVAATIVGVVNYGECPNHSGEAKEADKFVGLYDGVFVSEEYFMSVRGGASTIVFEPKATEAECTSLVEAVSEREDLSFISPIIYDVREVSSTLEKLKTTFFWIAIALIAFSAALTYWVISFSIEKRKGDVGILRANGAKKSDIAMIFFTESLITGILQAAIAIVISVVAIPIVNATLAEYLTVPITFIRLTPLAAILAVIVGILLNGISTVIPVVRTANKLPIDSIRNNIE